MTTFKSFAAATSFVRTSLSSNIQDTKFSVGSTPINASERMFFMTYMIFVRWTGGPSYNEIDQYLKSLEVTLHAGRGLVSYQLTRTA